MERQEKENIDI